MRIADRESDVLAACLQYLAVQGIFAWRQNQGAIPRKEGGYRRFVGLRGVSDILGILPHAAEVVGEGEVRFGNLLAVEVKRPGEKPRPEQTAFLERHGAWAASAYASMASGAGGAAAAVSGGVTPASPRRRRGFQPRPAIFA